MSSLRATNHIATPATVFKRNEAPWDTAPSPPLREDSAKYQRAPAGTFTNEAIERLAAVNAQYGPPIEPAQLPLPPTFVLPERTGLTRFREWQQDRFIYAETINRSIEAHTGEAIPEDIDFNLRRTLFDGRTAARLEHMLADEVKPIIDTLKRAGVTPDDVGVYLTARHAKERNAEMAKRDPERFGKGNGSGLWDEAADDLLKEFGEKGLTGKLEQIAAMVDALIGKDLSLRRTAGLITDEQYRAWRKMYRHYVPLRGFAERDDGEQIGRIGKGFDIRGREVRTKGYIQSPLDPSL